jgi:UDP-N-acetylmuramate--alanine ligase
MTTTQLFRGQVRCIHFVGIGGIGMSGIAEVLLSLGFEVHGSDGKASDTTQRLAQLGARIHIGHSKEAVQDCDVMVVSSAIRFDNVEVMAARERHIPVIARAEMLAELMRLKHGIAVAGSHGKTTTTSLVATVLQHAGLDPTVVIGGKVNQLGSNARSGGGDLLVAEADESDGSFLRLQAVIGVVTNIDLEHLDHYRGGLDEIRAAFLQFINQVPFYGLAVVCADDKNVEALRPHISRRVVRYGLVADADYMASSVVLHGTSSRFVVHKRGVLLGEVKLPLAGQHNVLNALACIAVADELAVPFAQVQAALASFGGVQRRFTLRGEAQGTPVIDDYGHHPAEIRATLAAARAAYGSRRIVVAFQPHRYSRTAGLMHEFASSFVDADVVRICPVYAAGEAAIAGANAAAMIDAVRANGHAHVDAISSIAAAAHELRALWAPGDVVITLGAGDITSVGPALLQVLQASERPRP